MFLVYLCCSYDRQESAAALDFRTAMDEWKEIWRQSHVHNTKFNKKKSEIEIYRYPAALLYSLKNSFVWSATAGDLVKFHP